MMMSEDGGGRSINDGPPPSAPAHGDIAVVYLFFKNDFYFMKHLIDFSVSE